MTCGQLLPPPGRLLTGKERASVAATALMLYRQRVQGLPPARRKAAEAEYWRLTVAAVRHTACWADHGAKRLLAPALFIDLGQLPRDGRLAP